MRFALVALLALLLVGPSVSGQTAPLSGKRWDSAVGTVDGRKITRAEFGRFLVETLGKRWLRAMVMRRIVDADAKARGIRITPAEARKALEKRVDELIREEAARMKLSVKEYGQKLAETGRDVDFIRKHMLEQVSPGFRLNMLLTKLQDQKVRISDAQVRKVYDDEYCPRVRVRRIVVGAVGAAFEVKNALERGADFGRLARERSLDKASFRNDFEMRPSPKVTSRVGRRAMGLRDGQRAMMRDGARWQVIERVGPKPGRATPLEEVAPNIRRRLRDKAVRKGRVAFLEDLLKRHRVHFSLDPDAKGWNTVVARYDGNVVRLGDLADELVMKMGATNLRSYALRRLLRREAEALGVKVSRAEVDRLVAEEIELRLKAQVEKMGMAGVNALALRMKRHGQDLEQVREQMVSDLTPIMQVNLIARRCLRKLLKVTPEEIGRTYREQYGERVKARQIVLPYEVDVNRILDLLGKGADFGELAGRFSLDRASGKRGGVFEIGNVGVLGKALFAMKKGERRKLRVGELWHIVEKLDHIPAKQVPLGKVLGKLRGEILDKKVRSQEAMWVMDLRANADIKSFLR